ncbi:type IV toxin-antitoxin system AbiEi family antitoxin domain-containing protein [Microbacterium sediminicola]|uniref:Type IV toxin-antitoxin system AbiEi family antitoxin domain-containing protein n=1 Tax=Microbacterium sediminicola TaxID=415210 RepID=A0ABP4TJE5_9MICO
MTTDAERQADIYFSARHITTAQLTHDGCSDRAIREFVASGILHRVRRGRFVAAGTPADLEAAARLGGRLDCVSLLRALGIFVARHHALHIQITDQSSRLPVRPTDVTAHWRQTSANPTALAADLIEALAQACRCQHPRDAIATLDSAWHLGFVDEAGLTKVFSRLPRRLRRLRDLLDPRCESGPETLMRLILRGLGCDVEAQVPIAGVGHVDFVVDGWLIIECDSKAHHSGWDAQRRDRRRDLVAASLGYTTIRPVAEDILFRPETVLEYVKATLAHRPGANSSRSR